MYIGKDFGVAHRLSISFFFFKIIYFVLTLFFLNNFYWSIADLQCVSLRYTAE